MKTQPQLTRAIEHIDKEFGTGYSHEHPELVGQYLIAHAIREIDETLSTSAQVCLQLAGSFISVDKILKSTSGIFKSLFAENK
jgi:hypothetical protein